MKAMKRRELVKLLEQLGFAYESEGRHPIYRCISTGFRIPVPNAREVSPGTLRDIFKLINKFKELKNNKNSSKVI